MKYFLIFAGVLAVWSAPATAEETHLPYEVVVQVDELHVFDVPGQDNHSIGMALFRGMAIFEDGRLADHWYGGHFDFQGDAGDFAGYAYWVFEDGSTLLSQYEGVASEGARGGIVFEGVHHNITGTGIYQGVSGNGTFEGERIDRLDDGGDTYQQGALRLELAGER